MNDDDIFPGWLPYRPMANLGSWWGKAVGPFLMLAGQHLPTDKAPSAMTYMVGPTRVEMPAGTTLRQAMQAARVELMRQIRELAAVIKLLEAEVTQPESDTNDR